METPCVSFVKRLPLSGDPDLTQPSWMTGLNSGELRRIELGQLLAKSDNAIRALVVDDEAYVLIAKLAAMLDARG